jgi:hypothetical protein
VQLCAIIGGVYVVSGQLEMQGALFSSHRTLASSWSCVFVKPFLHCNCLGGRYGGLLFAMAKKKLQPRWCMTQRIPLKARCIPHVLQVLIGFV